ncbi:2'-5' RNA ligase family protein [Actinoalloteichus hymeniacidonis]|uniref:2'-5' RNA ligase superfamily n=1 Tax=Actinoalloteichus hymeniacidonis TaxID=340345 RepID=A0AAC9HKU6_9PSEU|nr:2'-5' RNA ligase family protein [Actinoalloteichus hymeniacidonis]AOS61192.1 hypothetical protein TL08_01765 [Actinoalloteichus hymeniacidonis]MBB5910807.1 hypothetical protein [Actinoalloteichus hymeniacidonis]
MAVTLDFFFDDASDRTIRDLWQRLADIGARPVPGSTHPAPHVRFAAAAEIAPRVRQDLRAELRALSLPSFWLTTLGTFATSAPVLMLGAVVDAELLAVHSTVHDVLAGRVKQPSAYYLPGSWVPHCPLAEGVEREALAAGFAELHPVRAIHARVVGVGVVDGRTGHTEDLVRLG